MCEMLTSLQRSWTASFKSMRGSINFSCICSVCILGDMSTLAGTANSGLFVFFNLWSLDRSREAIPLTGSFLLAILGGSSGSTLSSFLMFSGFFCSFNGSGCGSGGALETAGDLLSNLVTFGLFIILNKGFVSIGASSGASVCLAFGLDLLFCLVFFGDLSF